MRRRGKLHTDRTRTITGGIHAALSTRLHNELRVNYSSNARVESGPIGALDGAVPLERSDVLSTPELHLLGAVLQRRGARVTSPTNSAPAARQVNIVDHLTAIAGGHQIKLGVDIRHTALRLYGSDYNPGGALRHGSGHRERHRAGGVHRGADAARAADAELLGVRAGHVARHAGRHADVWRALGRESGAVRPRGPAPVRAARLRRSRDGARDAVAGRRAALSHALVELRAARGRVVSARRAAAGLGHRAARRRGRLLRSRQRRDAVGVRQRTRRSCRTCCAGTCPIRSRPRMRRRRR